MSGVVERRSSSDSLRAVARNTSLVRRRFDRLKSEHGSDVNGYLDMGSIVARSPSTLDESIIICGM